MAESQALTSFGTLLQMGDGADPEVFANIAEVRDITPPNLSVDTEEVTHHESPGSWEEVRATILRSGTVTFEVNWLPANATHVNVLEAFVARLPRAFRLIFPTDPAITWGFNALITGFTPSGAVAGIMRGSITLKPSGPMDLG